MDAQLRTLRTVRGQSIARLLELFLDTELVGVSTLLLTAVGGTRMQTSIALTAHLLIDVV